jgi:transcriptional regulator with XRE-family HTH domain
MFFVDTDAFPWKLLRMDEMHPLEVWIAANSTRPEFARAVECSESHLTNIIAGRRRPSIDLLARIRERTSGAIDLEVFSQPSKEAAE